MLLRICLLILGVYACSTAVIMIKELDRVGGVEIHAAFVSSYRLLVAAAVLAPLFLRDFFRHRGHYTRRHLLRSILPAALLAAHFISWIAAVPMTTAANANLIVNMVPVVMPFWLFVLVRERINRRELSGTMLAVVGLAVLGASSSHLSARNLLGDVLCFVSMLFFAYYLALGRQNRDYPTVWLYMVPLYAIAGVLCFAVGACIANPIRPYTLDQMKYIVGLGVVPTVVGHSLLNLSMRHFRGQAVSMGNLGQFVFAGIMAWWWQHETPHWAFFPASALIVAGAIIALRAMPRRGLPLEPDEIPARQR